MCFFFLHINKCKLVQQQFLHKQITTSVPINLVYFDDSWANFVYLTQHANASLAVSTEINLMGMDFQLCLTGHAPISKRTDFRHKLAIILNTKIRKYKQKVSVWKYRFLTPFWQSKNLMAVLDGGNGTYPVFCFVYIFFMDNDELLFTFVLIRIITRTVQEANSNLRITFFLCGFFHCCSKLLFFYFFKKKIF